MTRNQKTILLLMSLSVLCLCAIFSALLPPTSPTAPNSSLAPEIAQTPTPLQHRGIMAQIKCERFIKDRLVSPSSAKFSYEKSYKVNGEPLNHHAVTGIVESQNRMGVLLQSQYRCDVHYLIDDPGVWVLDYLDIGD